MSTPQPIYSSANTRSAYQLHWSVTLFANQDWPEQMAWREPLGQATEADGVRMLEFQQCEPACGQFFVSTRPEVSPAEIVRSLKGRLQYIVRDRVPRLWRRHYAITGVGDANNKTLQGYVGRQVQRHPQADSRAVDHLSQAQFHDPLVDLSALRSNAHGKFAHGLQVVLENKQHLCNTRESWLAASRTMLVAACRKKSWLLSRIGLAGNHLHVLLGCLATDAPRDVALSLMNNLAFAHGMKAVYEHSFYVGTFGPYDHNAIRLRIKEHL